MFTLLISTSFFNSCSPDGINGIETNVVNKNPLEFIGVEHNKFMSKFTKRLEDRYKKKKWSNIEFLSDNYVTELSTLMNSSFHDTYEKSTSTIETQKSIYNQLNLNEWFDGDEYTSLDLAKEVLKNGNYTTLAKKTLQSKASKKDEEYTNNLLNDIYEVSAKEYNSKEESFSALTKVIEKHEKLILSENWSSDENYALGAIAIAKYSTQFWENYDFSIFENSKIANKSSRKKQDPGIRSSIVVGADVAGYVIGGVVGGVFGTVIGPYTFGAGTLAGVFLGKAVGGFVASGVALTAIGIFDSWSDFFN